MKSNTLAILFSVALGAGALGYAQSKSAPSPVPSASAEAPAPCAKDVDVMKKYANQEVCEKVKKQLQCYKTLKLKLRNIEGL